MIKSITFKDGGYITEKVIDIIFQEAAKEKIKALMDKKGESFVSTLSDSGLIRYADLKKNVDYKEKKVPLNPHLHKTLLNRTFTFSSDKVNIIFGPNASGKSTIIKTLASYCGCGDSDNLDGWTNPIFVEPIKFWNLKSDEDKKVTKEEEFQEFVEIKNKLMLNNADVLWDGVPVYNDNFSKRKCYEIGDLSGSIFGEDDGIGELSYLAGKESISLGQNSMFIFNKVVATIKRHLTLKDLSELVKEKRKHYNDTWSETMERNMEFYRYNYDQNFDKEIGEINTVMFDELDKSLDIENTAFIYQTLLPEIIKQTKVQIILVSHSPLILTDKIFGNPDVYNVISMDEKYTEKCRKNLEKFSFC